MTKKTFSQFVEDVEQVTEQSLTEAPKKGGSSGKQLPFEKGEYKLVQKIAKKHNLVDIELDKRNPPGGEKITFVDEDLDYTIELTKEEFRYDKRMYLYRVVVLDNQDKSNVGNIKRDTQSEPVENNAKEKDKEKALKQFLEDNLD